MYAVGSKVVHPSHGAGTIISIQQKRIGDRSRKYYIIDPVAKSMRLMVPVKRAEHGRLRHVGQEANLREVLATLRIAPPEDERWPDHRARQRITREKLKTGRFTEVASVVRTLYLLSSQRRLGMTDRQALDDGKDFLAGELALASGLELPGAMTEIEDSLAQMLVVEEE